jgi:hypothetical protein
VRAGGPRPCREILVLGDSRVGEGFSARPRRRAPRGEGDRRALGARARQRPADLVLPDQGARPRRDALRGDRPADALLRRCRHRRVRRPRSGRPRLRPALLCAALELADLGEFAGSFRSFDDRAKAARTVALRGFAYKHDFEALLVSPFERLRLLKHPIDAFDRSNYEYDGHEGTIRRETGDAEAHAAQKAPEPSPRVAEYRRLWLGRLLDRYAHSPTMICWVRIPRGPFGANAPPGSEHSTLRALAAEGRITLLREDLCVGLERPEYFFDGLHLNREGRRLLSPMLVDAVVEALAARR